MVAKKVVKIELSNPRFDRLELKDHASEFIHYAKYAGYILDGFNKHISSGKLFPLKPEIAERNHRLILETTLANAKIIHQITKIYPSFKNWTIKSLSPGVDLLPNTKGKADALAGKVKTAKKKKSAKKVAKRKVIKKKPVTKTAKKKKPAKKVAKKKSVKKPAKVTKKTKKKSKKK